jgi:thiol-disulfide isomerase/thioredoxin
VSRLKRNFLVLAVAIFLMGFAVYHNIENKHKAAVLPTEQAPKANYLAPSFTLKGLDGLEYKVGGPRDKPLLINFWASWCGPCAEEAPDLIHVYNKYKGQFDLYAINVTQGDKLVDVKKFVKEQGYPFPVLLDSQGQVSEMYRFLFIPSSFLIDKNGVIQEVINVVPAKELDKKIKHLINS